jgi:hypothetical protein
MESDKDRQLLHSFVEYTLKRDKELAQKWSEIDAKVAKTRKSIFLSTMLIVGIVCVCAGIILLNSKGYIN